MPEYYGGSALNPHNLMAPQDQWRPQWDRVDRWYRRVMELRAKAEHSSFTLEDVDTVIAFFQNCYHLKDWVIASRSAIQAAVDGFLKGHFEMRACRNICDGFKHKSLSNPRHPDPDFNLYREYDYDRAECEPEKNPELYRLAFADGRDLRKYDMFELAERCFTLWKDFIATHL